MACGIVLNETLFLFVEDFVHDYLTFSSRKFQIIIRDWKIFDAIKICYRYCLHCLIPHSFDARFLINCFALLTKKVYSQSVFDEFIVVKTYINWCCVSVRSNFLC